MFFLWTQPFAACNVGTFPQHWQQQLSSQCAGELHTLCALRLCCHTPAVSDSSVP